VTSFVLCYKPPAHDGQGTQQRLSFVQPSDMQQSMLGSRHLGNSLVEKLAREQKQRCSTLAVAYLFLVRRTYHMSIESDIVERVNRAASKKQIPISDTKQK
jgi:hypothetical protein